MKFFVRVLDGRYLNRADPDKGRFRSFMLTSLKFFVADEGDRQRAHKRGGGAVVPLEFSSGEDRYQREPAHEETPERIFERRWALSLLDRVVEKLRNEFEHHGRLEHFERLKVFLLGQSDAPYAALAREMNTSEGALRTSHSISASIARTTAPSASPSESAVASCCMPASGIRRASAPARTSASTNSGEPLT